MAKGKKSKTDNQNRPSWIILGGFGFLIFLCVGLLYPTLPPPRPSKRLQTVVELESLAQGSIAFRMHHGHPPPGRSIESIRAHLESLDKEDPVDDASINLVLGLDDAERLVFWLGDPVPRDLGFGREIFVEFGQVVDRDEDGFYEARAPLGGVYQYDEGSQQIFCDESDAELVRTIEYDKWIRRARSGSIEP